MARLGDHSTRPIKHLKASGILVHHIHPFELLNCWQESTRLAASVAIIIYSARKSKVCCRTVFWQKTLKSAGTQTDAAKQSLPESQGLQEGEALQFALDSVPYVPPHDAGYLIHDIARDLHALDFGRLRDQEPAHGFYSLG